MCVCVCVCVCVCLSQCLSVCLSLSLSLSLSLYSPSPLSFPSPLPLTVRLSVCLSPWKSAGCLRVVSTSQPLGLVMSTIAATFLTRVFDVYIQHSHTVCANTQAHIQTCMHIDIRKHAYTLAGVHSKIHNASSLSSLNSPFSRIVYLYELFVCTYRIHPHTSHTHMHTHAHKIFTHWASKTQR